MRDEKNFKILMAIDPGEPALRPTESTLKWFRAWAEERSAVIEAVYVSFSHSNAKTITEFGLSDYVSSLNLGHSAKVKIINESSGSRKQAVNALVQYIEKSESDLVVVSSHGRSGPGRLVLGSFAESLLAASPVPVLFLCETHEHSKRNQKILFPTDLSKPSRQALDLLLEQMKGLSAEIILYHAVSPPGAIYDTGLFAIPYYLPESYWLELKEWTDRESDLLLKHVQSKGFQARFVIQNGVFSTPTAIQNFAQDENVDFVAMASVRRGIESSVLGSTAKEIFRVRKWPVWVCGPEIIYEGKRSNENQS